MKMLEYLERFGVVATAHHMDDMSYGYTEEQKRGLLRVACDAALVSVHLVRRAMANETHDELTEWLRNPTDVPPKKLTKAVIKAQDRMAGIAFGLDRVTVNKQTPDNMLIWNACTAARHALRCAKSNIPARECVTVMMQTNAAIYDSASPIGVDMKEKFKALIESWGEDA